MLYYYDHLYEKFTRTLYPPQVKLNIIQLIKKRIYFQFEKRCTMNNLDREKVQELIVETKKTFKQKNNINYNLPRQRDCMKIGHRRTQSANIIYQPSEESTHLQNQNYHSHKKNEISKLIDRSEAKIKSKIYTIEAINTQNKEEKSNLFNFGKGLHRTNSQNQEIQRYGKQLVSIPQKLKSHSTKCRRSQQTDESSKKKQKISQNSILKIKGKQKQKVKGVAIYEEMNQIIKVKMGMVEIKNKKHSFYTSQKPTLKNFKHKKDFSNIK